MASPFLMKPFSADELRAMSSADPQPAYAELPRCPVHRGPDGTITLTRMADVTAVTRRRDVLGSGANGPTLGAKRPLPPLDLDGAEHLKYRRLLDPLFSAREVASLEHAVRKLADDLIDGFIDRKEADLAAEFCQPLPSLFFLRLMGIPDCDLDEFLDFKNAILGHLPPHLSPAEKFAAVRAASERCYAYFNRLLDGREAIGEPGGDLIGRLMTAEVDGERLGRESLLDLFYLLIIAGLDTVASSLASMLARLARAPELRRRLVASPELWPGAVEELLRYESPVQTGFRTATADIEVGGEVIPAGTTFFLCWFSANFDDQTIANPLDIDIERKPNPHVAFGAGFHRCLGSHLARMELRAALSQLHERIPEYSLKEGYEIAFSGHPRQVSGIPVVWG